jgi:hypothetical protein
MHQTHKTLPAVTKSNYYILRKKHNILIEL